MQESIENNEKIKCIEKNILSYIFKNDEFKEDEYTNKIHYKIYNSLSLDWENTASYDEIDRTLSVLIDKNYIYRNKDNVLRITSSGLEYSLNNNYIEERDIIDYCKTLYSRQFDFMINEGRNIIILKKNLNEQKNIVDKKLTEVNTKISNFYNNIISIMALLIAAFSIIGFNISGIKFIAANSEILPIWKYVISILVINLSIIASLFSIFYLIQKIINPNKPLFEFKKEIPINKEILLRITAFFMICNTLFFIIIILSHFHVIQI